MKFVYGPSVNESINRELQNQWTVGHVVIVARALAVCVCIVCQMLMELRIVEDEFLCRLY